MRVDEGSFSDGANYREGGVEDYSTLVGLVDVLVGVVECKGAIGVDYASSHGYNGERECKDEGNVIENRRFCVAWFEVEEPEDGNKESSREEEIPVSEELGKEDGGEVALVAEFMEEGGGGASTCVLRIDCIAEINDDSEGVDNNEEPFVEGVPPVFLLYRFDGEQEEYYVESICVGYCRDVET